MTFPVNLTIGSLAIHPHWLFESLAYTIAFWLYRRQRRSGGDVIPPRVRVSVIAAAASGGLIGSRLLYLLEQPAATLARFGDPGYLLGGKTVVGGLIGGLMAVEWTKRLMGEERATGDLFAMPLVVGIAIGRIGCFLSGLDDHSYGIATALPWGVNFGDGMTRHPTQLYEIAWLGVLAAAMRLARSRPAPNGDLFKMFMAGYMIFRFGVEFLKPRVPLLELSAIQWSCAAVLVYYAPHIARMTRLRAAAAGPPTVSAGRAGVV